MDCILQNAIELNLSFGTKGRWYHGSVGENIIMSTIYFKKKSVCVCVCREEETVWGEYGDPRWSVSLLSYSILPTFQRKSQTTLF